jgi:hypothetical protein
MTVRRHLFGRIFSTVACAAVALAAARLSVAAPQGAAVSAWMPEGMPGIDTLADTTAKQVRRSGDPSRIAAFDDVRDVMSHASEWRWYSRDNGILLAIPVRERLGIPAKVEGENELADVIRRLINQAGWGNPPVQVVLIEPEQPCHERPVCPPCECVSPIPACGCE